MHAPDDVSPCRSDQPEPPTTRDAVETAIDRSKDHEATWTELLRSRPLPCPYVRPFAFLALLSAFLALPTACGSTGRYVVAQSLVDAWTAADRVAADAYHQACPSPATTDEERAACHARRVALDSAVHLPDGTDPRTGVATHHDVSLEYLVNTGRGLVSSAVIGLYAADQAGGDDPPDLGETLSCVAAAIHAAVLAVQELHLSLPATLEAALEAINRYGGSARLLLLGQCPGFDGTGGGGQTGSAPPPAHGTAAPGSATPSGVAVDACAAHADGSAECGPGVS